MSSKKRVIDTYYMARNKRGYKWDQYLTETSAGVFTGARIIGERYLSKGGADNAIARYIDGWSSKFQAGERPVRKDFKIVKVTVRR